MRATEYTVGAAGPEAMPGALPPSSAYTYAAELSVDEAVAAGADRGPLQQAGRHYVENFLGFPVGGAVPTGYYDRDDGEWKAAAERPRRQDARRSRRQGHRSTPTATASPTRGLGIDDAERTPPGQDAATSATSCGASRWTTSRRGTTTGPTARRRTPSRRRRPRRARRPGQPPPAGVQQEGLDHRLPGPGPGRGARRHRHAAQAALRHPPRGPSHGPLDRDPAHGPQDPESLQQASPPGLGGRPQGDQDVRAQDRPLL